MRPIIVDITGRRFGRLTALGRAAASLGRSWHWRCICDCGKSVFVRQDRLCSSGTRSCGCLQRDVAFKHGYSRSAEYKVWCGAKERCTNPRSRGFKNYGGRGIFMCPEWMSDFTVFLRDMGPRPPGMTLDRYPDNNGPYSPENCRWATAKEQNNNTRSNRALSYNGRTMTLAQWAEEMDITPQALRKRLLKSPVDQTLSRPSPTE